MRKRTSLSAFTIAELLVVMAIISILALWISRINFQRLSQNQQISIETAKIVNLIEEARNNALIGKWVGVDLITPESWSIVIENDSSSGSLTSRYLSWWTLTWTTVLDSPFPFSINNLECRPLNNTAGISSWSFTLTFTWSVGGISGCSNSNYKIISFDYWVWTLNKNININTLSWIIEVD
jgi:prepilin-type N-terminal cleavage/methylation domain-containing protein